jgi:hypothetical protein
MQFLENPFSGSRVVPCEQTDRQTDRQSEGQTDTTKLKIAFRNSANAPKKLNFYDLREQEPNLILSLEETFSI